MIGALGGMSNGICAVMAVQGFGADLRESLFRKVQTFSFGNLDELETGQLITRLTNDVTQVQEAIQMMLRILVRAPLLLVGSLVMAIVTSPQLAFLPLVLMPIELAAVVWIVNKATPLYTEVQERLDALNEVMQENLAGVRVVKAFVRAQHEEARFGAANDNLMDQTVHAARTVAVTMPFMMLTHEPGRGGRALVWRHPGDARQHADRADHRLCQLPDDHALFADDGEPAGHPVGAGRGLGRAHPGGAGHTSPRCRTGPRRCATFRRRAGWPSRMSPSATMANGSATRCSRTSALSPSRGRRWPCWARPARANRRLVHLIPRFYDVTAGRVTLDGVDVRDVDQDALRRHIGIALQETVLFSGTIRDNIRYGRPDATEEEVIAAAKAAQAHDFILSFPDGYDTVLGQRGVNLSGGQKQRIAIARALLLKPAVLILDDSTSSVDVETETKIQAALEDGRCAHRTSFVIAQRISTVLKADKILVLDDGQIAAEGTHRELLASSPIYREIYDSQLGNGVTAHELSSDAAEQRHPRAPASPPPVLGPRPGGGPMGMLREVEKAQERARHAGAPVGLSAAPALGA